LSYGIDLKMQDPIADGGGPSGVHSLHQLPTSVMEERRPVVMVNAGAPVNGTTGDNFAGTSVLCMLIRLLVFFTSIPVQLTTRLGQLLEPSLNVDS
jgi:hypothetical protein